MDKAEQKLMQYLTEACTAEHALIRVLQAQIAMTPRGSYRSALENHLEETRHHAQRVSDRLRTLDDGFNPVTTIVGFWEDVLGQMVALGKAPFDLVRGTSGEEKVLKNAKDTCATESLEIATYTAIQRVADRVSDRQTADLAADILEDEQRMLDRVMRELPRLADAVVGADIEGNGSYDVTETGAAETVAATAERAGGAARDAAREARRAPGVTQAEGEVKGAVAAEDDLPIAGYDDLTAAEVNDRLPGLSQVDLGKIDAYERERQNRATVLDRVDSLRGEEPWPGYDEQNVSDVNARLAEADEARLRAVHEYERAHKNRVGVLRATDSHPTS